MPSARPIAALTAAMLFLGGCQKSEDNQAQDQTMSIDEGVPANQVAGNADIETLPADESSTTPSNQLQNGFDSPEVNETTSSNAQ
jgi:hypothetical protein